MGIVDELQRKSGACRNMNLAVKKSLQFRGVGDAASGEQLWLHGSWAPESPLSSLHVIPSSPVGVVDLFRKVTSQREYKGRLHAIQAK